MNIPRIPVMATIIHPQNPVKPLLPVAAEIGVWLGEGEPAGDPNSGNTFMVIFIFSDSQWLRTPQMYHFLPGDVSGMVSSPVVKASVPVGALHCWNPVPLTLNTLCVSGGYLKTAQTS